MPGIREDTPLRRAVDVVVATGSLVVLAPVFAVVAVAIKLESAGPVFFAQRRVGVEERPFRIFKFRSMVQDASRKGPKISGKRDPRITRVGGVLRATKLDEFPQLWNVLRGEMTLIGPRAEIPEMVAHYTEEEKLTLRVRPGLTCPGQLHFTTDQAADLDGIEDPEAHYVETQLHPKLALDLAYLRRRSLATDLSVVGKTLVVMAQALTRAGADA
ncbi:MAG TPA: sugar transferase [Candidatus Bathyarchaeia archaeon]|nr:sugar transferase [Candidatus Bathyarchaeia archaeon]